MSTYSTSRTKPEAHMLSRSSIYKRKAGRRGRHASQQEAKEGTQASASQREARKPAQARGRHAGQQEGEEGMYGSWRERKGCMGGRGRGRYVWEPEGEEGEQGRQR